MSSAYDAAGRRRRRITPFGAVTEWDYDQTGQPARLTTGEHQIQFGYDPAGREIRRDLPGDLVLTQDWDQRGRLTLQALIGGAGAGGVGAGGVGAGGGAGGAERAPGGAEGAPGGVPRPAEGPGRARGMAAGAEGPAEGRRVLQRRAYSYNCDGLVTGIEDLLAGTRAIGLDQNGRVTAVHGPDWAEQYAYDPAGNLAAASWPSPSGARAGAPAEAGSGAPAGAPAEAGSGAMAGAGVPGPREVTGTLVARAGNVRYRHDRQGRVVQRLVTRISRRPDVWRYQWDADNRLTAVTTPDGSTWRYRYDPFGRRIAKQHLGPDGEVTEQTDSSWDGPVLAEQSKTILPGQGGARQVVTWDYRPGSFTPVTQAEHISVGDLAQAAQEQIDRRFYAIITDLVGTPAELAAPDGTLAGRQQHTLWGTTTWASDGAQTPLRFPGQYADPETGLHYNQHRYYDPVAGAYLTPDPLGLAAAPNPHAYVGNPQVLADPLGLAPYDATTSGPGAGDGLTRVGRWMSHEEYQGMLDTRMVQPGRTGVINVASPADPLAYIRQAPPGSVYVEFDVPEGSLVAGGSKGWATIPGPDTIFSRLNIRRGLPPYDFPPAQNVQWIASKLAR